MDTVMHYFSEEAIQHYFETFESLGIVIAFLLPFIEAFLPILPIAVFAVVNVNTYGLLLGFLITWIGAVSGGYVVFLLVRKYGQHRFLSHLNRHPHTLKFIRRVDEKGVVPLFILLCFPFTPSSVINVVAGLSAVRVHHYLFAVLCGKAVMLFMLSFIGNDIYSFVREPKKSIIVAIVLFVLWLIGKWLEKNITRSEANQ
ncbi:TVP38/TMEM64 family protein [Macrococcoides caseolyticum]|uniref:TVP38/TMEM64 family protein n=1 Tax=Macrococcoides caseolyticum TaxID=69966 RepID=UPI001F252BB2|nr:TVP38/TMEM64 family protein [Macrococcus caseolyticus]MCE4955757.1 TVP38/TMEM64 family protein [Macrococcus caseolyticus]